MKKSYLNSERKSAVSLKPSMTIRLLLMVLFVCLFVNVGNAANISSRANGNWSSTATWTGGVVPSSLDNVTISNNLNVNVNTTVHSVNVIGTLNVNSGITFTVGRENSPGSVTVGGTFSMVNNGISTLIVYGNYNNNGETNFWKSNVLITGNLSSPSTSKLQNNGNVIVGGNIIGKFDVTGGTGTGQIYALNPNSTVSVTPTTIGNNIIPGVAPTTESATLINLVNQVNYGGSCSFTVDDIESLSTCSGSNAVFTVTTNASSPQYQWQVNVIDDDTGWIDLEEGDALYDGVSTAALTITAVTISMNSYQYRAKITAGSTPCTMSGNSGVLTVNAALATPTAAIPTQPTCVISTGSVVLSDLPASGTLIQTGYAPDSLAYTGTTKTITGLAPGTYYFAVTASGCTSSTVEVIIKPALTNTWSGLVWDNGTPDKTQKLVFAANYALANDIVGCSCQVNNEVSVTIRTGHTLTLTHELKVIAPLGTLAFEDGASLVQINNVATNNNTGDIEYYRSTYSRLTDYNYLSTPVSPSMGALGPQTIGEIATDLSNGTFYSYKPTATGEDWELESAGSIMVAGKGYIATRSSAIPQSNATIPKLELQFSGIPNNGTYEISGLFAEKSYLLGNPYPSALDADAFLNANKDVLNGTLYFWTHNTAMKDRTLLSANSAGLGAYAYTTDDYATYNATGGVAVNNIDLGAVTGSAISGNGSNNGAINNQTPSGKIASGQGFFASSKLTIPANSKIVFDNTMRVGVIDLTKEDNSQFFKTRNPKIRTSNTTAIEKNRVWLTMSNAGGAFKQTLVGYLTDATNDYDDRFDGESFDGNEFIDFYSLNQDHNLTIQGRALPFNENDEVPLGYRTTINGDFTINIAQVDGVLTNQVVFIEDKLTNTVFNLKTGNYTFRSAPGTFNDRFVLKYKDTSKTLAVDTVEKEDGILAFYSSNYNTLIIRNDNFDATVNSVALFNVAGQKMGVWDVSDNVQTNIQVPIKNISSGIYIVKVSTTKGESSKKIIVN